MACDGRCRRDGRRGEIDFRFDVSHAPHEIAVGCRNAALLRRENAHVAAQAISAGDDVSVELAAGEIADLTTGQRFRAEPFPPFMMELIAAGGLSAYLKGKIK